MEKKIRRRSIMERLLQLIVLCLLFLLAATFVRQNHGHVMEQVGMLEEGWYYLKGDQKTEVSLPAVILQDTDAPLVLYHEIEGTEMGGMTLSAKGARYDLKAEVDGQSLYEYQDDLFRRNIQMSDKLNCNFVLPADVKGKTLALTFANTEAGRFKIEPVYYGTCSAVFCFLFREEMPVILMVFAMAALSVVAIAVSLYLRYMKMEERRYMDAALFTILCGVWCITDSSIVQQLTALSPVTNLISFYAFMLMSIPMIHFIRDTETMEKYVILDYLCYIFYGNLVMQSILNYLGYFQFVDMLFVTHLLLIMGIALIIFLLWKEYRATGNQNLFPILRAFVIVSFGGVLSLILYWALEITYYEIIYELGILIFIVYLLAIVIKDMVDNIQFRMEVNVARRMAKVDSLTGMGNRNAFEDYLEDFEEQSDICENALLIFLDIDRLKDANDRCGHSAGDEMILSASRCIERTFAADGVCFRIDGDEFCVIIPDPKKEEASWYEKLNEELHRYNQNSRNRISISHGSSYLIKDGVRRNVSDWKYEADQRMHENKGWRKLEENNNEL